MRTTFLRFRPYPYSDQFFENPDMGRIAATYLHYLATGVQFCESIPIPAAEELIKMIDLTKIVRAYSGGHVYACGSANGHFIEIVYNDLDPVRKKKPVAHIYTHTF